MKQFKITLATGDAGSTRATAVNERDLERQLKGLWNALQAGDKFLIECVEDSEVTEAATLPSKDWAEGWAHGWNDGYAKGAALDHVPELPTAERMSDTGVIERLFNTADDYETDTLTDLMIRAGILWRCDCEPGNWDNREDENNCGRCGRPRSTEATA